MTPIEFKAWFEGFTEAMDKLPTAKQWARIKERVSEIGTFSFVIAPTITVREQETRAAAKRLCWSPNPNWAFGPDGAESASVDDWQTAMNQAGRAEYQATA